MEGDPTGRTAHEPGAKLDQGKAPVTRGVTRQFPRAVEAVSQLTEFGANKYSWSGWEKVPDGINRYADARGRHDIAVGKGEETDPDTGLLHRTAIAWNALAELELYLRETGYTRCDTCGLTYPNEDGLCQHCDEQGDCATCGRADCHRHEQEATSP